MPFFIAVRAFAGRIPREVWYAIGATLLLWLAYDWAYDRGVSNERAKWEREVVRLRAVAAQEAARRVEAVSRAVTAEGERRAALALKLAPIIERTIRYETTPAGRAVCPDGTGKLLAQSAIDATNADIAATPRAGR